MNRVAIMQPTYLPWLGYFAMIDQADTFVLLDTVPISRQSWQTRNKIRLKDGRVTWLSIPTTADYQQPLDQVAIDYSRNWEHKHWRTIEQAYNGAEGWDSLRQLEFLWSSLFTCTQLSNYTSRLIEATMRGLGIDTQLIEASTLIQNDGHIDRLAGILHQLDASTYLATPGSTYLHGHTHLDDIPIEWFNYQHPTYTQGNQPWMSHLSIIDCIAHCHDPLTVLRTGHTVNA